MLVQIHSVYIPYNSVTNICDKNAKTAKIINPQTLVLRKFMSVRYLLVSGNSSSVPVLSLSWEMTYSKAVTYFTDDPCPRIL